MRERVFYGHVVHSVSLVEIEYLRNALLGVNDAGLIAFVEKDVEPDQVDGVLKKKGWQHVQVTRLAQGSFIIPGLIDTHTHVLPPSCNKLVCADAVQKAPQYVNLGFGQQYELLDWLKVMVRFLLNDVI